MGPSCRRQSASLLAARLSTTANAADCERPGNSTSESELPVELRVARISESRESFLVQRDGRAAAGVNDE
eukprot:CAMPEP_0174243784 /NCGR_PEP_ID=MMETSP0417-20130205/32819_1 /TAXON_ID=242541 /ORGANISM="Mayorella sp, Strain BSH-02190019" /LENGTH=69 /DNA_ID=CAMNT_0015323361 /DNA_START=195 /DNA_END=401 /DNA_ORIENTATION=+